MSELATIYCVELLPKDGVSGTPRQWASWYQDEDESFFEPETDFQDGWSVPPSKVTLKEIAEDTKLTPRVVAFKEVADDKA